jgi:hypothetical protein
MTEEELIQSKTKPIPTPTDFIYHIVSEIEKMYLVNGS